MERFSSIEHIIGKTTSEEKQAVAGEYQARFEHPTIGELEVNGERHELVELEKTADERMAIGLANQITNDILQEFGKEPFDISETNVFVVEGGEKNFPEYSGRFRTEKQNILIARTESRTLTLHVLIHEMLHFKGYGAAEMSVGSNVSKEYRSGLGLRTREAKPGPSGHRTRLVSINEAVTELLAQKKIEDLLRNNHPFLADELEQSRSLLHAYTTQNPDLTIETNELFLLKRKEKQDGAQEDHLHYFSYPKEKTILFYLIQKIIEHNPDEITDPQEVLDMFTIGYITGQLLPIGKLIDRTFGPGTFRTIAELDSRDATETKEAFEDKQSALEYYIIHLEPYGHHSQKTTPRQSA